MTHDPTPLDPVALTAAADGGDGEAAHRLAVLSAMGLAVPHDWGAAFRRLEQAARLGFVPAEEQRDLLSPDVDLERWLAPPPPRPISRAPAIFAVEGFLATDVCDYLRARAEDGMEPAMVYDPVTGDGRAESVRTNAASAFGMERMDVVLALVRERIARLAGLPVAGLESSQILHYRIGQKFDWHVDWLDPALPGYAADLAARGQRIATCLVFLNDDFEGGETAFEAGGIRHRGRKGDALLWANTRPDGSIDPGTRHAGLPPTKGEKWVLSQWLRGRAPTA